MKDQGTSKESIKLHGKYWIMVDGKPKQMICVMINVCDASRAKAGFVKNDDDQNMYEVCINPTAYNNWGFDGLFPAFETEQELIDFEVEKLNYRDLELKRLLKLENRLKN